MLSGPSWMIVIINLAVFNPETYFSLYVAISSNMLHFDYFFFFNFPYIYNSGYILQLCRRQNLITFTEEIFNGKLQFLCIVIASVTLEDYRTSQV